MKKSDIKDICDALGALRGFIEAMHKDNLRDMQTFTNLLNNTLQANINERSTARKSVPPVIGG